MNYISFIKDLQKQEDNGINSFLEIAQNDGNFPNSSDPIKLAQYLYLQLTPEQTLGFQKTLMIYQQVETANQIPPKYKNDQQLFLKAINYILKLQDNDSNYPYADLLPKNK
jgi:hypothetical protein